MCLGTGLDGWNPVELQNCDWLKLIKPLMRSILSYRGSAYVLRMELEWNDREVYTYLRVHEQPHVHISSFTPIPHNHYYPVFSR